MEEIDSFINNLEDQLEKEQQELAQTHRQHHSDWDNHIFTLSTASLGFVFTFLPLANGEKFSLIILGIISFILSICVAAANYIFADKNFVLANQSFNTRKKLNIQLKRRLTRFKHEIAVAKANDNLEAFEQAKQNSDKECGEIYDKFNVQEGIDAITKNNSIVIKLNHIKTYAFIIGILFVVYYALINVSLIGK